jgi:hypothetical protein
MSIKWYLLESGILRKQTVGDSGFRLSFQVQGFSGKCQQRIHVTSGDTDFDGGREKGERQMDKERRRNIKRETEKQRNRETEKQRNRETEKQRNRETDKQRNRETEKQRNRETEKQRNRETET